MSIVELLKQKDVAAYEAHNVILRSEFFGALYKDVVENNKAILRAPGPILDMDIKNCYPFDDHSVFIPLNLNIAWCEDLYVSDIIVPEKLLDNFDKKSYNKWVKEQRKRIVKEIDDEIKFRTKEREKYL
jgi:hypothetical protein